MKKSKVRISADQQYLVDAGWVRVGQKAEGFITRVMWRDPVDGREMDQQLALYREGNRQARAAQEVK